ncbi:TetR/AcrR family transcriptional regulator [Marinobacter changyiensis]|uniref:TetR/AcrR family transcriptional regulator n=1 Tax=Marinobacter changyiensis TaxID=2604091 RepID=UPI0012650122|nr:TetR/AcrR family transcriptional regulator [Marinobacter changyiensis]
MANKPKIERHLTQNQANRSPFDREQLRESKRDAVLHVAASAFNRRGYTNTSMDNVAEALQITKPTLYRYFKNKQQILFELHMHAMNHGEEALRLAHATGSNGLEKFLIYCRRYMQGIFGEFGTCPVLVDVDSLKNPDKGHVIERRAKISKATVEIIEEGIADGSIDACDAQLAALYTLGALNWMPLWYREDGRKTAEQVADEFVGLFERTLAKPVTRQRSLADSSS